ncbi:MAG: YggT family protein [Finegoldia sp.]|nr:YggT family protein [Finegoldia sp.]
MGSFSFLRFLLAIVDILEWTIIIRVLLSYIVTSRDNVIVDTIFTVADTLMRPAKILLYKLGLNRGMLDWSPLVTLLFLGLISNIVVRIF